MSQLSRPYQIALAVVLLFAVAWFAVLRQHEGSSTKTSAPPVASTPSPTPSSESTAAAEEKAAAAPTKVYKGAAPGVEGLTRDVRKAHEAVGVSQQKAHEFEGATGEGSASAKGSGAAPGSATTDPPTGSATSPSGSSPSAAGSHAKTAGSPASRVSRQLKEGRTALILIWNPHSSIDVADREQVQAVTRSLGHKVAASYAKASELGRFGTVTRDVTVNETPTLLVIGKKGQVTTITGLTDAFSIEQAVREAA